MAATVSDGERAAVSDTDSCPLWTGIRAGQSWRAPRQDSNLRTPLLWLSACRLFKIRTRRGRDMAAPV